MIHGNQTTMDATEMYLAIAYLYNFWTAQLSVQVATANKIDSSTV